MSGDRQDLNTRAASVVAQAVGAKPKVSKDPAAIERGRKGGLTRASRMTPEDRQEDARRAVNARWAASKQRKRAATG